MQMIWAVDTIIQEDIFCIKITYLYVFKYVSF